MSAENRSRVGVCSWILLCFLTIIGMGVVGIGFITMFKPYTFEPVSKRDIKSPSQEYLETVLNYDSSREHKNFKLSQLKIHFKSNKLLRITPQVPLPYHEYAINFSGTSETELGNQVSTSVHAATMKSVASGKAELTIITPREGNDMESGNNRTNFQKTMLSFSVPPSKTHETRIICSKEGGCHNVDSSYCSRSMTYAGNAECEQGELCGTCSAQGFLKRLCILLVEDLEQTWKFASAQGCSYPYEGIGEYGYEISDSISIEVRCVRDPLVAAQRATKGTMDFTTSEDQSKGDQRRLTFWLVGAAIVLAGIILLLIAVCFLASFCKRQHQRPQPMMAAEAFYVVKPVVTNTESKSPLRFVKSGKDGYLVEESTKQLVDPLSDPTDCDFESVELASTTLQQVQQNVKKPQSSFSDMI